MGSPQNPSNGQAQGNPGQGNPQQGGPQRQVHPQQVIASIEEDATTGWCILTSMILLRVRLDREGATKEDRNALLDFWQGAYVEQNVEQVKGLLDQPENRMAAMQQGQPLDQLLDRLGRLPNELRQKFGTFLLNGVDHPVGSIKEAVEQFKALQNVAKQKSNS